ncbi:hypothetical protein AAY47_17560 [Xenorhabdus griffiniae]|nr:hypothetical protein AAY47_17560 [Xenorhabdus griffiniae]
MVTAPALSGKAAACATNVLLRMTRKLIQCHLQRRMALPDPIDFKLQTPKQQPGNNRDKFQHKLTAFTKIQVRLLNNRKGEWWI